jgi:hypothetical protein
MLLTQNAVSYCQIVRKRDNTTEIIAGVKYHNNTFVGGKSYPKHQKDLAIGEMRRSFLDPEPPIACILVESDRDFKIWHEDPQIIKLVEGNLDIIKYTNLDDLLTVLMSDRGVEIKDRMLSFRPKVYKQSFVGKEAVNWIVNTLKLSREEAVALGQRAIDEGKIVNAIDGSGFKDKDALYQKRT